MKLDIKYYPYPTKLFIIINFPMNDFTASSWLTADSTDSCLVLCRPGNIQNWDTSKK